VVAELLDRSRPLSPPLASLGASAPFAADATEAKRPCGRLAYLVMRFPAVTETFILREMVELERQGMPIELFVVIRQAERVVHPDARGYLGRMHTSPFVSLGVLWANVRWLARRPRALLALWSETVKSSWRSPSRMARGLALLPKAAAFATRMQELGVTHVHAHYATHTAFMAYAIHRLTGIGMSFTAHAHDIYLHQEMLSTKLHASRFVATISEFNRSWLERCCGAAAASKVHVVRCGVVPERYEPGGHRDRPDHQATTRFRMVTVASLRDYKGIPVLIEACRMLRGRIPGVEWELIGEGPDRKQLEALIARTGVGDLLKLVGPQPENDVARRMRDADAFVLTSVVTPTGRMEGIPVALMEAMVVGLPTVATRISGIGELVQDGETGWLVPPGNAAAVADALVEIHRDPREAHLRAARGRAHVLGEFTVPANVARLRGLFESALSFAPAAL